MDETVESGVKYENIKGPAIPNIHIQGDTRQPLLNSKNDARPMPKIGPTLIIPDAQERSIMTRLIKYSTQISEGSNYIDLNDLANQINFLEGFLRRQKFDDDDKAIEEEQKWLNTMNPEEAFKHRQKLLLTTRGNLEARLNSFRTERDKTISKAVRNRDEPFFQKSR